MSECGPHIEKLSREEDPARARRSTRPHRHDRSLSRRKAALHRRPVCRDARTTRRIHDHRGRRSRRRDRHRDGFIGTSTSVTIEVRPIVDISRHGPPGRRGEAISKVFVHLGISLDGFIAGPNRGRRILSATGGPRFTRGCSNRMPSAVPRHRRGGREGHRQRVIRSAQRPHWREHPRQADVRGGEANWPEVAPFHTDRLRLTHEVRAPWARPGGTTFHFVNGGIERLSRAREAAGSKTCEFRAAEMWSCSI